MKRKEAKSRENKKKEERERLKNIKTGRQLKESSTLWAGKRHRGYLSDEKKYSPFPSPDDGYTLLKADIESLKTVS